MNAEIIAIGDEVVKGYTVNTNASYIANAAQECGVNIYYHTAICDDPKDVKAILEQALGRSKVIFITGGLGPTKDDLTKETVCEVLQMPLVFHGSIYDEIVAYFKRTGRSTPENNRKQAYFPKGAVILANPNGTAPGCMLEKDQHKVFLLPGPPKEMIPMFENHVMPLLDSKRDSAIWAIDIRIFGLGESHVAEILGDQLGVFDTSIVATYVSQDEIIVRIRAFGESEEAAALEGKKIKKAIESCLKEYIIGYNDSRIEELVMDKLKAKGYSIAAAESCTGGLVASTLINCSGVSSLLGESIVTYSNEAKQKYLGVKKETLATYGAVSQETATEMAEGIKKQANAQVGLATTGIAGPEGGTPTKPVGTVYIGLALPHKTYTFHLLLEGSRQEIRQKAVKHILYKLYRLLIEE